MESFVLEEALAALGELLAEWKSGARLVVVGGAALNLRGDVSRTTNDVEVIARARLEEDGTVEVFPPEPLPKGLVRAATVVARDFALRPDWLNTEIAAQWRGGLPPHFEEGLTWKQYNTLHIGLPDRAALIALKLFAAVDRGPRSVHYQDLVALAPKNQETEEAASWVKSQDAGSGFAGLVEDVVMQLRSDVGRQN